MFVEVLEPSVLRMPELSDDAFFDLCTNNEEYRIERTAEGRVIIMSGTGARTGARNSRLSARLLDWSDQDGTGASFDSSTIFRLANSAMRSPDAAWLAFERMRSLDPRQLDKFLPLSPDFIVELTSPSDRIKDVQLKLEEWIANGVQLGWILEVEKRRVHVYRAGSGKAEILENVNAVQGEGPLATFTLDLTKIWDPGW